ncbi:MAG: signal peptidase II [Polyangiales bacterium]
MIVSLVVYTALDLASKDWAIEHVSRERSGEKPALCVPSASGHTPFQRLPTTPIPLIEGVLRFSYAENCGAAFSLLRTAPAIVRVVVFGVANAVALAVLFVLFVRGSGGAGFAAAVPLIASGAIGNIADRVRHGFVVDFIQVDPSLFRYPVFNVADIWIAIGVGLLLLDNARKPRAADDALQNARARA